MSAIFKEDKLEKKVECFKIFLISRTIILLIKNDIKKSDFVQQRIY